MTRQTFNGQTITTNSRERELVAFSALPDEERTIFDYIDVWESDDLRFFKAYGSWYDLYEFERAPDSYKAHGWDGVQTQSAFSAIVVRYFDSVGYELSDAVIVGYSTW